MLCRVALVRGDVSEELSASIIRATRIGELGTTLAISSNRRTLGSGEYEECRYLGYINTVHTSQETQYVSATESSRLKLCKI
jgi:hypothetical protein